MSFGKQGNKKHTHHTIGIRVTGFRHRETLDNFWSHPWESSNQGHVCGVVVEPRGAEVTDLRTQEPTLAFYRALMRDDWSHDFYQKQTTFSKVKDMALPSGLHQQQ